MHRAGRQPHRVTRQHPPARLLRRVTQSVAAAEPAHGAVVRVHHAQPVERGAGPHYARAGQRVLPQDLGLVVGDLVPVVKVHPQGVVFVLQLFLPEAPIRFDLVCVIDDAIAAFFASQVIRGVWRRVQQAAGAAHAMAEPFSVVVIVLVILLIGLKVRHEVFHVGLPVLGQPIEFFLRAAPEVFPLKSGVAHLQDVLLVAEGLDLEVFAVIGGSQVVGVGSHDIGRGDADAEVLDLLAGEAEGVWGGERREAARRVLAPVVLVGVVTVQLAGLVAVGQRRGQHAPAPPAAQRQRLLEAQRDV